MGKFEARSMTYKISTTQITETTAPVVEPVTLAEAKSHLRVDGSDSDTIIGTMIIAARQWAENYCQRSFVQRTYRADVEGWAARYRLPLEPFASLSSVKYYTPDSPQVLTTLDTDFYRANLGKSEIYVDASSSSYPSHATRDDAVQITYVAGDAPTTDSPQDHAGNVSNAVKAAILLMVGDLFENREGKIVGTIQSVNPVVEMLLSSYRIY